jgi:hypothetical protein
MLEICPRGAEKTELFACLFLQRLPREIRVLLAKADLEDLADEADQLWGMHDAPATLAPVLAADVPEEATLVAVRRDNGGRGGCGGRGGRGRGGRGRGAGGAGRQDTEPDISREARLAAAGSG